MRTRAYVRGKVMGNGKAGGIFWKTTFKGNKSGLYYLYVFSTTPKFVHIPWVRPVICLCRKAGHIIQPGSGLPMSCSLFMETSCYQGDRVLSGSVFISGHTWWAQAFCSFTSCVARTPKATRSPNTSSLPEADGLPPKPLHSSADTALIGNDMDKLKTGWNKMQANLVDLLTGKEIPI